MDQRGAFQVLIGPAGGVMLDDEVALARAPDASKSADPIVIAACDIATRIGSGDDHRAPMSRLLVVLCSADRFAQGKIENCLVALYTAGKDAIDREIARRNAAPTEQRSTDRVLRTLLRVRHRTNEALTA